MMNEVQLLKLKKQVEDAKQEVSELRGHQLALLKQLKDEWECKDIPTAEKKLKAMQKELEEFDQQIEEGVTELEEKYGV